MTELPDAMTLAAEGSDRFQESRTGAERADGRHPLRLTPAVPSDEVVQQHFLIGHIPFDIGLLHLLLLCKQGAMHRTPITAGWETTNMSRGDAYRTSRGAHTHTATWNHVSSQRIAD
jgi:hypothetical protein